MPGRRTLAVAALVAASVLCVALLEIRVHETGSFYYRFLIWNLILAWVPFGLALTASMRARRHTGFVVVAMVVLWLLSSRMRPRGRWRCQDTVPGRRLVVSSSARRAS